MKPDIHWKLQGAILLSLTGHVAFLCVLFLQPEKMDIPFTDWTVMLTSQEMVESAPTIAGASPLAQKEEPEKALEPPPQPSKTPAIKNNPAVAKRAIQPEVAATSPKMPPPSTPADAKKESALDGTGRPPALEHQHSIDKGGQSKTIANAASTSDARNRYLAMVRQTIERHKRYPQRAVMRGLQGEVGVKFILTQDGTVTGLTVTESSGEKLLDEAALAAVQAAAPFAKIPDGLFALNTLLELKIVFALQ